MQVVKISIYQVSWNIEVSDTFGHHYQCINLIGCSGHDSLLLPFSHCHYIATGTLHHQPFNREDTLSPGVWCLVARILCHQALSDWDSLSPELVDHCHHKRVNDEYVMDQK